MKWFGINTSSIFQAIKINTRSILINVFILSVICVVFYIPIYLRLLEQYFNDKETTTIFEQLNETDEDPLDGWPEDRDRNPLNYLYPYADTTIREPEEFKTAGSTNKNEYFLLVMICSALHNFKKRITIRETWGNYGKYLKMTDNFAKIKEKYVTYYDGIEFNQKLRDIFEDKNDVLYSEILLNDSSILTTINEEQNVKEKLDFKILFLLGLPTDDDFQLKSKINEEIIRYDDIVQEKFIDTYNNLSIKSIFLLKWVTKKCNNKVRYILKCDDDSYINLPVLMENLRKRSKVFDEYSKKRRVKKKEYLMIGDLHPSSPPVRNNTNKWYCPLYMYKDDVYPSYLSGTGYVMSLPTAHSLYEAALRTKIFHLEDIYITGMCSVRANPPIIPENDRVFYNEIAERCGVCCAYPHITVHRMMPRDMWSYSHYLLNWDMLEKCEKYRLNMIVENKARMYVICTMINPKDPECRKDVSYWNV